MNEPVVDILSAAREQADAEHKAGFQVGSGHPAGGPIPPRVYVFYVGESAGVYSTFAYGEDDEAYELNGPMYEERYGITPEQKASDVLENAFGTVNPDNEYDLFAAGAEEMVDEVLEHTNIPDFITETHETTEYIP